MLTINTCNITAKKDKKDEDASSFPFLSNHRHRQGVRIQNSGKSSLSKLLAVLVPIYLSLAYS